MINRKLHCSVIVWIWWGKCIILILILIIVMLILMLILRSRSQMTSSKSLSFYPYPIYFTLGGSRSKSRSLCFSKHHGRSYCSPQMVHLSVCVGNNFQPSFTFCLKSPGQCGGIYLLRCHHAMTGKSCTSPDQYFWDWGKITVDVLQRGGGGAASSWWGA